MSKTIRIELPQKSIDGIVAKLETLPAMLREKMLKKALKEAAEIFTARVKHNVQGLKSEGRDRWLREVSDHPLEDNIRTRTLRSSSGEVGVGVDIHGKGDINRLRQYAASVEFGHNMVVYGRRIGGAKVPEHQYWRPAKTATLAPIDSLIKRALKRLEKEMVYKGK